MITEESSTQTNADPQEATTAPRAVDWQNPRVAAILSAAATCFARKGFSATTLAEIGLENLGTLPLIWNTYPFHPHKPGQPLTNRRPRKTEMRLGETFLSAMLDLFPVQRIIAIGNVAHETLSGMGFTCTKVRHPAQGGKNDFVTGLHQIFMEG